METRFLSVDDFKDELCDKISDLRSHHFIAKNQSSYLEKIKNDLKPDELAIVMDFSENYAMLVQDSIQAVKWDYAQATLHPFVIYSKNETGVNVLSVCMISDCIRHDAIVVHAFIAKLYEQCIHREFQNVRLVHYFSDGSPQQYKNFKNLINLCHNEVDFGVKADWSFFATSHGKSACDGIGGTVKRLATRASLQRPLDSQILMPLDLFKFCDSQIKGIQFYYIPNEDIKIVRTSQENRFSNSKTISGTRENHFFEAVNMNKIGISHFSGDKWKFNAKIRHNTNLADINVPVNTIQPGNYIACVYDGHWWFGNVCDVSTEEREILVNFMHPNGPSSSFTWPNTKDQVWVPEEHILIKVTPPKSTFKGRTLRYDNEIVSQVDAIFTAKTF